MTPRCTSILVAALAAVLSSGPVRADALRFFDGSTRTGRILLANDHSIRMLISDRGISSVWDFPTAQVACVVAGDGPLPLTSDVPRVTAWHGALPAPAVTPAPPPGTSALARAVLALPAVPVADAPPAHGFAALSQAALSARDAGPRALLHALKALAAGDADAAQLDAFAQKNHATSFGEWLAETRWQAMRDDSLRARVYLIGITDAERGPLLNIMRGQTLAALEPLHQFMPDRSAPAAGQRRANPLWGVTLANCRDVRQQALLATAVLRAQLDLDRDMPREDARLLRQDLADVYPILDRATRGCDILSLRQVATARWAQRR